MALDLPRKPEGFMHFGWADLEPHFHDLAARDLSADSVGEWLADWSALTDIVTEMFSRLAVAVDVNTADEATEARYLDFVRGTYQQVQAHDQELVLRLLKSGLEPEGFGMPLMKMRSASEIYRDDNVPLFTAERELDAAYNRVVGAQTVTLEGQEVTTARLKPYLESPDRDLRESVYRLSEERQLADREALSDIWCRAFDVRARIARNADLPSYREYRWRNSFRFDYTEADCATFRQAILEIAVPAASRLLERRRERLGVASIRPWDLDVDPYGASPLKPFTSVSDLEHGVTEMIARVDSGLADYLRIMQDEGLLDLDNRKNKAPGGYSTSFDVSRRPFIFMNAVGRHDDVETLVHEAGHAFHCFLSADLPYAQLRWVPMEFCEVASMGMVFLAWPYLECEKGGFYTRAEAARATITDIERNLLFWPYMAVVDGFQHWAYENPAQAIRPDDCDRAWAELMHTYMPDIDYEGLEDSLMTGWQRKPHIFISPFYYVEYGLAQLAAVNLWKMATTDPEAALAAYRSALSLGGSVPLPELFRAAGTRFAFDAPAIREAVSFLEASVDRLLVAV